MAQRGLLAPAFLLLLFTLRLDATPVGNAAKAHNLTIDSSVSLDGSTSFTDVAASDEEDEGNFTVQSGKDELRNITDHGLEEDNILFEGDIEISLETLHEFYDINETMEKELIAMQNGNRGKRVSKRAATSIKAMLWPSRTVPYVISSAFTAQQRQNIFQAMRTWSTETCVMFVARSSQADYIQFIKSSDECSSNVGRLGGRQYFRLTEGCANSGGTILHMIGHVLGLWHEQSRPDRDSYVTILWQNIQDNVEHNFEKRDEKRVDYQGSEYDYGSIMHYSRTAFVKPNCPGCHTIVVNNNETYISQDSPVLGYATSLSSSDAIQVKRLYKCPGEGQEGLLRLYIRYGRNLEDTDTLAGDPDPYVKIEAISSTGYEYVRQTSHKRGTQNPTWNQELFFCSREWQFFRISVWDSDLGVDDPMGMSVTVPLLNQPRVASRQRYCTNTACNRYIYYDYKLLPVTWGRLRVKVRYARNLPDTDTIGGDPDPYVRVKVQNHCGSTRYQTSSVKRGTTNPTWNTWLSFSLSERSFANYIMVQVFDDDVVFDDAMSDPQSFHILTGYRSSIRHCVTSSCGAFLIFDYEVQPNKYERRLSIYARYGRNLPDEDRWPAGDSDPYLKVVAYDINGNSRTETTSTDQGDEYPEWFETLNFGVGMWTKFEVSVWDNDVVFDDRLSRTHSIYLPSTDTVSRTYVSLSAYRGYVVIDYYFT